MARRARLDPEIALEKAPEKKTTDAKKLPKNVKVYSLANPPPPNVWRIETVPEQRLRDKVAHDLAITHGGSWNDKENRKFVYNEVKGISLVPREVSYDEVCKMFGWESFSYEMNDQTVRPKWLNVD